MVRDDDGPERRSDDEEMDALYLAGSPMPADPAAAERIAESVVQRLQRRRRGVSRARRWAAVAAAATLLAGIVVLGLHYSRRAEERMARSPEETPSEDKSGAPRKSVPENDVEAATPPVPVEAKSVDAQVAKVDVHALLESRIPADEEALLEILARKPGSRSKESATILDALAGRPRKYRRLLPRVFELDTAGVEAFGRLRRLKELEFEIVLAAALQSRSTPVRALAVQEVASRSPVRGARLFWMVLSQDAADSRGAAESFVKAALPGLPRPALSALVRDVGRMPPASELHSRARRQLESALPLADEKFAEALAASGAAEAWPLLQALLEARGPQPELIRAVGRLGDPRAVSVLERWLYLGDGRAEAAVEALGRIPGEESLRLLCSAYGVARSGVSRRSPDLQGMVTRALLARREEALGMLVAGCRKDPGRELALASLTTLFPDEAVAVLEELLREAPSRARPLVARSLALLETPEAIQVLVEALDDPELRRLARQSLRRVADSDLGASPRAWKQWFEAYSAGAGKRTSRAWTEADARTLLARNNTSWKEAL